MKLLKKIKLPLLIFLFSLIVYNANLRNLGTTDTITNENLAEQIAVEGQLSFDQPFEDQYKDYEEKPGRENIETQATSTVEIDGKHYSKYPIFSSVISSPVYLVKHIKSEIPNRLVGKLCASLFIGFSNIAIFLSLKKLTTLKKSLLITLIYGFASSTWPVSSQALWQHSVSQFFTSLAIFTYINYITSKSKNRQNIIITGILLSCSAWARTTNLMFLPILFLPILKKNKKDALIFALSTIPVLLLMFGYNQFVFGNFLSTGYTAEAGTGWSNPFFRGLFGLTISPSVGIFVFSPIFLFTLAAPFLIKKNRKIYTPFIIIVLLQILIYSKWWAWYGDSWAYRFLTDVLPFWVFLFIPVLEKISNLCKPHPDPKHDERKKLSSITQRISYITFSALLILSIYVQLLAAFGLDYSWHDRYGTGHNDQQYLFNVKNSQIFYYLKRQRYYITYPEISLKPFSLGLTRDVIKIPDKYGSIISFENNSFDVIGDDKFIHAVELGSGVSPTVEDGELVLDNYYDGITLYIRPEHRADELEIEILVNSGKDLLIKEISNGRIVEESKIDISNQKVIKYRIQNFPEEIRIQNDATDDSIRISQISLSY